MDFPAAFASTHEYRMKVRRSGLYLLLATLLILVSIPVATRGLVGEATPVVLGRVIVGALVMLSGAFMVATVLRSRLVIEDSQIRFRVVFREKVFALSEIAGIRTATTGPASHRVSRRVICVRGRREPIEIALFGSDNFLQAWLQQFPSLDRPDGSGVEVVGARKTEGTD
jgi:hypothetical protein